MDPTPFSADVRSASDVPIGLTTRALVHLRAHELAAADGYRAPHISQANYEQAQHELTGTTEARRIEMLQALHEAEDRELQLS